MHIVEAGEQKLVFDRSAAGERVRCTFNLSSSPTSFASSGTRLAQCGEVSESALGPYAATLESIG